MEIVEGGKALEGLLVDLGRKVAGKISRQSLRAGAKIIQAETIKNAPDRTGLLRKSIKVRAGKSRPGKVSVNVTIDKGFYKGEAFYGAFVELGHRQGSRKLGYSRAFIPGQHFMEKAFKAKATAATEAILSSLKTKIEAAAGTAG